MQLVDATGAEGAVPGDVGGFGMAYAASDLVGELLADDAALPHAAAPQAEAEQEYERQEQRELREAAADPGVDEADVGRRRVGLRRRLAGGAGGDREEEGKHIV